MTLNELYRDTIKPMPLADRLRLATLILEDVSPRSIVDYREDWTDADIRECTMQSLKRAEAQEEPDDAA